MGKDGELWDDSALINAFDDAVFKYKVSPKMHGKGGHDCSFNEENGASVIEEKSTVLTDECVEAKSHMEADDNDSAAPNDTVEAINTMNPLTEENHSTEAFVVGNHVSSSNGQQAQETEEKYANTQGTEDYNRLMNQYNELEEQRQKVLQQLYEYGGWHYEGYDTSTVQVGPVYGTQQHQVPASQTSCPTAVCTCRSYVCPFPTTSLDTCCYTTTCAGKTYDAMSAIPQVGSSVSVVDGDVVKTAMGAVERALGSITTNALVIPEVNDKRNKVETSGAESAQNKDSKTDLNDVLNAWFSAGFYTGKYLSEQSNGKK